MMGAASPRWWQRFEADRQEHRLREANRALRGDPALDSCSEQVALIAQDLLALAALPSAALTARDWRVVQECAVRLLTVARVAEATATGGQWSVISDQ
jgi:hypothetical protein